MKIKAKNIVVGIVILGVSFLIVKNILDANRLNEKGVYVIGHVDKIRAASGGLRIYVSYTFNGRLIEGDYINANSHNNKPTVKKYFMKIDPINQNHFDILYNIPVPDSLTTSPTEGWKELPAH